MPDDDNEKITFLVLAQLEGHNAWTRPLFVRAASLREAYVEVLSKESMFQHPHVTLQGFLISPSELPDIKDVARTYWEAAQRNAGHDSKACAADFEALWEEHGAGPIEDDAEAT